MTVTWRGVESTESLQMKLCVLNINKQLQKNAFAHFFRNTFLLLIHMLLEKLLPQ